MFTRDQGLCLGGFFSFCTLAKCLLGIYYFFIVGEVMAAYYLTSDLARQKPGVRMGIAATLIGWPMVGRHLRDVIRSVVRPKPEPNPREPSNVFDCSGGLPLLDLMFYRLNRF